MNCCGHAIELSSLQNLSIHSSFDAFDKQISDFIVSACWEFPFNTIYYLLSVEYYNIWLFSVAYVNMAAFLKYTSFLNLFV